MSTHSREPLRDRWYLRLLPELLVLVLVGFALVQGEYDVLGVRGDASTDPAAVSAPSGIDLPALSPAGPVAAPVPSAVVDPAAVRRAIGQLAADPDLGPHRTIRVADLRTGRIVFQRGPAQVTPASTLKLLTTTAALHVLGPDHRFTTSTVLAGNRLYLVGGGDPYLSAHRSTGYPRRTSLEDLAARTASALRQRGITRVGLRWDDGLFTGPAVNPTWPSTYLPENVVPPITALWDDEAHTTDSHSGFVADPSRDAAKDFRSMLRRHGIRVAGFASARAPRGAGRLAAVRSVPLAQIVEETLAISDNQAAELLGHAVGRAVLDDASFEGGARAVFQTLTQMGVRMSGVRLYDGSGLSREDRVNPDAELDVLRLAASAQDPELRAVLTGLPVAGYTGSLAWRFADAPVQARGMVRAKTGTLTGVHGLSGVVTDRTGAQLVFVIISDRVPAAGEWKTSKAIDGIAAALGACRCGRPD